MLEKLQRAEGGRQMITLAVVLMCWAVPVLAGSLYAYHVDLSVTKKNLRLVFGGRVGFIMFKSLIVGTVEFCREEVVPKIASVPRRLLLPSNDETERRP